MGGGKWTARARFLPLRPPLTRGTIRSMWSRRVAIFLLIGLTSACKRQAPEKINAGNAKKPSTRIADLRKANIRALLPIDEPKVLERSALGSKLDREGNVALQNQVFEQGDSIYLTLWLKESPGGLQTHAHWTNAAGQSIAPDQPTPMNGARHITFHLPKSPGPGKYHVVGFWGGNVATDYEFSVIAKKGSKRKL